MTLQGDSGEIGRRLDQPSWFGVRRGVVGEGEDAEDTCRRRHA